MSLRVKELCKEKGISLKDLAAEMHITYQALFESINGNPSLNRLMEIASALGVDVTELFEPGSATIVCPHCGKQISIEVNQ